MTEITVYSASADEQFLPIYDLQHRKWWLEYSAGVTSEKAGKLFMEHRFTN